MRILMMTNTYLPHVGGVARSVDAFTREYRRRGHRVLVVAPQFEGAPADEPDVVRVPAIQNFNGSDFAVRLPIPGYLVGALNKFEPELVHAHHPFLLGDTALRVAAGRNVPLVFTHHTMYERYTHYVPGESDLMKRYVIDLSTGYANLCDRVFAPSESVADVLRRRGVEVPLDVVPTGVDVEHFARGDRRRLRDELGIPPEATVVGHVGRLAPEKNLPFLAQAVAVVLQRRPDARFLVVGSGPSEQAIEETVAEAGAADRLHLAGVRSGQALVDAFHAMDVFAFASHSETQGMVLTEAMAAGLPTVALDAPGAREVVRDGRNGRLLPREDSDEFAASLEWVLENPERREMLRQAARETAEEFSMPRCAERALAIYGQLLEETKTSKAHHAQDAANPWEAALRLIEAQWDLWSAKAHAAGTAVASKQRRPKRKGWLERLRRLWG